MTEDKEITCYHGTNQKMFRANQNFFLVKKYHLGEQAMKKKKGKKPGSLGYGIYAYKEKDMAMGFAEIHYEDDPVVAELKIKDIDKMKILDFNDEQEQDLFHDFRKDAIMVCEERYGDLVGNNMQQHEMDGILIELYISNLIRHTKGLDSVDIVKSRTFTPLNKETRKTYSFIPNGTEFCIRKRDCIEFVKSEGVS